MNRVYFSKIINCRGVCLSLQVREIIDENKSKGFRKRREKGCNNAKCKRICNVGSVGEKRSHKADNIHMSNSDKRDEKEAIDKSGSKKLPSGF